MTLMTFMTPTGGVLAAESGLGGAHTNTNARACTQKYVYAHRTHTHTLALLLTYTHARRCSATLSSCILSMWSCMQRGSDFSSTEPTLSIRRRPSSSSQVQVHKFNLFLDHEFHSSFSYSLATTDLSKSSFIFFSLLSPQ
jgi:hypothetical protein